MAIETSPRPPAALTLDDVFVVDADVHVHETPTELAPFTEPAWRKAVENAAAGLKIMLSGGEGVPQLHEILTRDGKGRGQVNIVIAEPAREIELKLPGAWAITAKCRAAIRALPGIVEVQDI